VAEFSYETPLNQLRQGDIFGELPFVRLAVSEDETGFAPVETKTKRMALLLNQSCDIDKDSTRRLILLPIAPLAGLSKNEQSLVKKNRILNYLHLPGYRDSIPDLFLVLSEPMTVDREIVQRTPRIASLSSDMRRALVVSHSRYITRWLFTSITCIGCGATFDPSATLPIIND